jgi:hypothetical protein
MRFEDKLWNYKISFVINLYTICSYPTTIHDSIEHFSKIKIILRYSVLLQYKIKINKPNKMNIQVSY